MTRTSDQPRKTRITGEARQTMVSDIVDSYRGGASIRELAARHNMSFGFIHGVLTENEVPLRGRGGDVRKRSTVKA